MFHHMDLRLNRYLFLLAHIIQDLCGNENIGKEDIALIICTFKLFLGFKTRLCTEESFFSAQHIFIAPLIQCML